MARKKPRREIRELHTTGTVVVLTYDEAPAPYKDLRMRRKLIQKALAHRVATERLPHPSEIINELSHIYGPNSPEGEPWILDLKITVENPKALSQIQLN